MDKIKRVSLFFKTVFQLLFIALPIILVIAWATSPESNVKYIRHTGYALLLTQIINPLYEGLMGTVLTWHNPPGHRFASFTVDQTNLGIIFFALIVILISWIMAEGCKLREEQQLTI